MSTLNTHVNRRKVREYTFRIRIIWKKNNSPKGTVARNETAVHMACQRFENYVKHSNSKFIDVKIMRKKILVKNIIIWVTAQLVNGIQIG